MIVAEKHSPGCPEAVASPTPPALPTHPVCFSFDIEEHYRIEAANGLTVSDELKGTYRDRMEHMTRQLLDLLAARKTRATFYIVGEIARTNRKLIQDIAAAGHEIGSHSQTHLRVHSFNKEQFRDDLRQSVQALEDASGQKVVGFRAPTFSVDRKTAWAIDVLAELGFRYDSSIFPVRHDRYGVPDAPRKPFRVRGEQHELIELPPATYRFLNQNLPVAGGGYFRLFPLALLQAGVKQLAHHLNAPGMLYFHPWEFDSDQPKLELKRLSRWRTYVGIKKSIPRLRSLLEQYHERACRAIDLVEALEKQRDSLELFRLG